MLPEFSKKNPNFRKSLLKPFVKNVNPNIISVIALLCSFVSAYFFIENNLLLAGIFILLNGFFDILDGEIAKAFHKISKKGDFLDHVFDRVADLAILLGITYSGLVNFEICLASIIATFFVSYLGTQAQAITSQRLYGGLIGRADRLLILALISFGGFFIAKIFFWGFVLLTILSIITALQRFFIIYRSI